LAFFDILQLGEYPEAGFGTEGIGTSQVYARQLVVRVGFESSLKAFDLCVDLVGVTVEANVVPLVIDFIVRLGLGRDVLIIAVAVFYQAEYQ